MSRLSPGSITGLSSMATRQILAELAETYEQLTGQRALVTSMGGVAAAERVRKGEPADVVVLACDAMERLEAEGHLLRGSLSAFACSGIAVAVPIGAAYPDLGDEDAVRRACLAAGRLGYSTGPSGTYLRDLWQLWGVDVADPDKAVLAPPGVPVGKLLTEGKADLGFQQLSELIGLPGIAVVGPLPPAIQLTTVFTAGIGARAADLTGAREFITFLLSSDAEAAIRKCGMAPPR